MIPKTGGKKSNDIPPQMADAVTKPLALEDVDSNPAAGADWRVTGLPSTPGFGQPQPGQVSARSDTSRAQSGHVASLTTWVSLSAPVQSYPDESLLEAICISKKRLRAAQKTLQFASEANGGGHPSRSGRVDGFVRFPLKQRPLASRRLLTIASNDSSPTATRGWGLESSFPDGF